MSVLTSYIQLPGCRHRAGEEPDFARMGFARPITTKGVRDQGIEGACKIPDKVGGLQSKPGKKERGKGNVFVGDRVQFGKIRKFWRWMVMMFAQRHECP